MTDAHQQALQILNRVPSLRYFSAKLKKALARVEPEIGEEGKPRPNTQAA